MIQLYGFSVIVGLLMAASDGIWFPQLNLAGLLIFAISLHLAGKHMKRSCHGR